MHTNGWSIRMAFMACSTQYWGSRGGKISSTSSLLAAPEDKWAVTYDLLYSVMTANSWPNINRVLSLVNTPTPCAGYFRGLVLECRQHKCHSLTVNLHFFKHT